MKIILGQGNPGKKYAKTRHNVGFVVLDYLAERYQANWQTKPKWQAEIAEFNHNSEKVLLIKPTCFYNLTGEVVRKISDFYKIDPTTNLLVIHDDVDLPFGTIRTRGEGGAAGNNGLKSIISHIGTNFKRLKIGTKNSKIELMDTADFVLAKFSLSEKLKLKKILTLSDQLIDGFLNNNFTNTKQSIN